MEYRQFGQIDLQVSAIGFGCWEIGGTYGKIDEAQFHQAVQRADRCPQHSDARITAMARCMLGTVSSAVIH